MRRVVTCVAALAIVACANRFAAGQAAAAAAPAVAPAAPVVTVWQKLGIPQGFQRLSDGLINRRGNFPGLERKPPLKRIADPANLESKNPAIKKAAEVKMEEDMAKQKIKAIKYLAEMGCYECYPGIKDALLAALDDCTEKVRFAAAKAIAESVRKNCETCSERCCCDEQMTEKLADVAFGFDEEGCYKESSERVRREAAEALRTCCPNCVSAYPMMEEVVPVEPGSDVEGIPQPKSDVEGTPEGDVEGVPAQPTPAEDTTTGTASDAEGLVMVVEAPAALASDQPQALPKPVRTARRPRPVTARPAARQAAPRPLRMAPLAADDVIGLQQGSPTPAEMPTLELPQVEETDESTAAIGANGPSMPLVSYRAELQPDGAPAQLATESLVAETIETPEGDVALSAPEAPALSAPRGQKGHIKRIDQEHRTLELHFPREATPPVGTRLNVYHQFLLERAHLGEVQVIDAKPGHVVARAPEGTKLHKLEHGDEAVVR